MMGEQNKLALPVTRDELRDLRAGDELLLSGPVFTARDATHRVIMSELENSGQLPFGLDGQTLFYSGPTPPKAGRAVGSVGPTTSKRMDVWTPELMKAGIVATIGKGMRSEAVRQACVDTGSVYFATVGGAAALLGSHVTDAETIAYPELGTEALTRLELKDFPVLVAIDARGSDLYATAPSDWISRVSE